MKVKLERKLGLFAVISIGISATVGSGIFSTISEVAGISQSGIILVLAFIIGGFIQIPANFCYAELSSAYPEDGGCFIYLKKAGAKNLAFFVGWAAFWLIEPPSISLMGISLANYLSSLFPLDPYALRIIPAILVALFSYLNIRSVEAGSKVQILLTVLKILPFIIIFICGIFYFNWDTFNTDSIKLIEDGSVNQVWFTTLLAAVGATVFSYEGMYSPSYMTGEIKNPKKNMPIAFIALALIVVLLYFSLTFVSCGVISIDQLALSPAPIADVASQFFTGDYAGIAVAIMAIVVITGSLCTSTMYMPRIEYAMAKDGYFFKCFAKVHEKFKTPYVSIILNGLLAIVLIFIGDISTLLSCISFVSLFRNFATFATLFVLRKKDSFCPSYKCPGGLLFPFISCSLMFIMGLGILINSPIECFLCIFILFGTGYFALRFWKKKNKLGQNV